MQSTEYGKISVVIWRIKWSNDSLSFPWNFNLNLSQNVNYSLIATFATAWLFALPIIWLALYANSLNA
jgi:hypothetical protein